MTAALLSELARVKVLFQRRAICLHMGINPDLPLPSDATPRASSAAGDARSPRASSGDTFGASASHNARPTLHATRVQARNDGGYQFADSENLIVHGEGQ